MSFQDDSWFSTRSPRQYPDLVGQIYFPVDSATLDVLTDETALRRLVDYFRPIVERQPLLFRLVGSADYRDPRGSGAPRRAGAPTHSAYNQQLGLRRANSIKAYLDHHFRREPNYRSIVSTDGDTYAFEYRGNPQNAPSDELSRDRKVDIFCRHIRSYTAPPITLNPRRHLSNRFLFQTIIGVSGGVGPAAVQAITVNILNPRSGEQKRYMYTGAGPGFGVGVNRPTDFEEKRISTWLTVHDFEGDGKVFGVGVGMGSTCFVFEGPKKKGLIAHALQITFNGWDFGAGFETDVIGWWEGREVTRHPSEDPPRGRY